jgi:ATP-dependent RNA helicase DDX46/PRP5
VSGNVSSFGLKSKAKLAVEKLSSKRTLLLDDEEVTKRRTLEKLPDPLPQDEQNGYAEGDDEDIDMEDVGSDEESAAAARAAAAKRRDEAQNNGDIQMAEASNGPQDDASNSTNDEREDIDPLDAFMSGLKDPEPDANPAKEQAVAMFSDNDDLNIDNVETNPDDILAMASKKKKKDIPTIDHSKIEYEPFRKCFYTEPIELQEMTEEEVADLRLELDGIKVRGVDVPKPVQSWAQMGLSMQSLEVLRRLGYEKPTSIQSQAIPCVSSGRDCIGVAKTGSGKTAAFLLPLFRHIKDQRPLESSDGPIGLIMAPTRERATQIHSECKPFLKALSLKACVCYGGAPIKDQIAEVKYFFQLTPFSLKIA